MLIKKEQIRVVIDQFTLLIKKGQNRMNRNHVYDKWFLFDCRDFNLLKKKVFPKKTKKS